jgi:hypothetical protein
MAILLRRPNDARARPSSLLKDDKDYASVFNEDYLIDVYLACARVIRAVEEFLKEPEAQAEPRDRNNLRFYVALAAVQIALADGAPRADRVRTLGTQAIPRGALVHATQAVKAEYEGLGGGDTVAKGALLGDFVVKASYLE